MSVCLSGSHTFLVVRHSYVSQATHAFLGMLPLCFLFFAMGGSCSLTCCILLICISEDSHVKIKGLQSIPNINNAYLSLSETSHVKLMMYDGTEGLRTIPDLNNIEKGKVEVLDSAVFTLNVKERTVAMKLNGKSVDFGSKLVYIVTSSQS